MWELYVVITNNQMNKESLPILCLFVLLLSCAVLIIRDGERKVLTVGDMFYNSSRRHEVRRHSRRTAMKTAQPSQSQLVHACVCGTKKIRIPLNLEIGQRPRI